MKRIVGWLLEHLDMALDHAGGCMLLNRRILFGYNEATDAWRIDLPNRLTYPLWCWSQDLPGAWTLHA